MVESVDIQASTEYQFHNIEILQAPLPISIPPMLPMSMDIPVVMLMPPEEVGVPLKIIEAMSILLLDELILVFLLNDDILLLVIVTATYT